MLLGYAMESAQGEWQSVLPYDESSGLIAELVGHLASLLMQLNIWRRGLAQERPLEEWLPVCRDMLNAFFLPDAETEAAMTLIEQQWLAIIAEGLGAQYGDVVPLSLLRDELAQRLDQERISQRFLAGSGQYLYPDANALHPVQSSLPAGNERWCLPAPARAAGF